MSIAGVIVMWVFAVFVFFLLNIWPMGKESKRREAYWARFEGK